MFYRSPYSELTHTTGQIILFGCRLELQADGKLPPVLEYLFDSFPIDRHHWVYSDASVGPSIAIIATNSLFENTQVSWPLVKEVEQAWTGVEASDRASISKYDLQSHHRLLSVGLLLSFTTTESLEFCRHISVHFQTQCSLLKIL